MGNRRTDGVAENFESSVLEIASGACDVEVSDGGDWGLGCRSLKLVMMTVQW